MKTISVLIFSLFMAVGIVATPTNNFLEITAHLGHLFETKEKCFCSEAEGDIILYIEKCCFYMDC